MASAVKCKLLLYADDLALLVAGKNAAHIQQCLSSELQSIREWLIDNRLSLHLGKTEAILFGSKRRLNNSESLNVPCDGQILTGKSCVKYLGVELDQSLSGNQIAEAVLRKANAKLKFVYRQTRQFDMETKKLLTSALIQCHFDYASASWYSGLTKKYQNRLQTTQNKIVRFLMVVPPRTHIGYSEFEKVKMLPVNLRVIQLKLNHIHNIVHGQAPSYLKASFFLNASRYNTRSGPLSLVIPSSKSFGQSSFAYTGAIAWNNLRGNIQSIIFKSSFMFFKCKVKSFLSSQLRLTELNPFIMF